MSEEKKKICIILGLMFGVLMIIGGYKVYNDSKYDEYILSNKSDIQNSDNEVIEEDTDAEEENIEEEVINEESVEENKEDVIEEVVEENKKRD